MQKKYNKITIKQDIKKILEGKTKCYELELSRLLGVSSATLCTARKTQKGVFFAAIIDLEKEGVIKKYYAPGLAFRGRRFYYELIDFKKTYGMEPLFEIFIKKIRTEERKKVLIQFADQIREIKEKIDTIQKTLNDL